MTDEEMRAIVSELLELIGETRTTQSRKLEQAVGQLVIADGVLAGRIDALENFARSFKPGNEYGDTKQALLDGGLLPPPADIVLDDGTLVDFKTYPKRPSRWARFWIWAAGPPAGRDDLGL